MDIENLIVESKLIEVASYKNYKEATFLISVLDQPDLYGRIIPSDAGEKYCTTLIGFPIVAKLKKNIFGQVSDFGGHEVLEVKAANGKKKKKFMTHAIGSITDAWVEDREVEGYDGEQKCILAKSKLWTSRFPEYFKVFDKLWEQGKVQSSWELAATKVVTKGANTIYKVFEFIGNCVLGSSKTPAVPGAGVIEYAELDDFDTELAEALEKDIAGLDIETMQEKEDFNLAEELKNETLVEDTAEKTKEKETEEVVDETSDKKKKEEETAACGTNSKKKKVKTAEANVESDAESTEETTETASLTDGDLFRKISEACRKAVTCDWGYVSYWFPEEHTVWFKPCNTDSSLDYKLFTYEVTDDEVTVSDPKDVKLTVSVTEVNDVIAEKDEKIGTLTAELELKDASIIKAGEKINALNVEISELTPYKEKSDKAEQERIETEIAEHKKTLRANMLKGNLFSEEELESAEIAELIEARNEKEINSLIAERYIASFDKEDDDVESAEHEDESVSATASLETDDIDESPSAFMKNLLTRK